MHFLRKISKNVKKLKYLNEAETKYVFLVISSLNRNSRITKDA